MNSMSRLGHNMASGRRIKRFKPRAGPCYLAAWAAILQWHEDLLRHSRPIVLNVKPCMLSYNLSKISYNTNTILQSIYLAILHFLRTLWSNRFEFSHLKEAAVFMVLQERIVLGWRILLTLLVHWLTYLGRYWLKIQIHASECYAYAVLNSLFSTFNPSSKDFKTVSCQGIYSFNPNTLSVRLRSNGAVNWKEGSAVVGSLSASSGCSFRMSSTTSLRVICLLESRNLFFSEGGVVNARICYGCTSVSHFFSRQLLMLTAFAASLTSIICQKKFGPAGSSGFGGVTRSYINRGVPKLVKDKPSACG